MTKAKEPVPGQADSDDPQSQSIPGPTYDNPNEDVQDGNQARIQPGTGSGNTVGGETTGDTSGTQ